MLDAFFFAGANTWRCAFLKWTHVSLKQTQEKGCSAKANMKGHMMKDSLLPACTGLPYIAKLSSVCWDSMNMLRQDMWRAQWCLEGINRSPRNGWGGAWLVVQGLWVSHLCWSSLPWERHSSYPSWSLPLTQAEAEACLSLLDHVTPVVNPALPNWTAGASMNCLQVDRATAAC